MKEKKRARLKALVVAFILVFAGFATLMTIPGPATAEGPRFEAANEMMAPNDGAALNEENELLEEGEEWYHLYYPPHRRVADNAIGWGTDNPINWYGAIIIELPEGEARQIAFFIWDSPPYAKGYLYTDDGGAPGELLAETENLTDLDGDLWHEVPFVEPVNITNGFYWVILEMEDPAPDIYPLGVMGPYMVEHGGYCSIDFVEWFTLMGDYNLDWTWTLEALVYREVPGVNTLPVRDEDIYGESVNLRAPYTLGAFDEVEVFFQYRLEGEPWTDVGHETYNASGTHNFELTGLDPYVLYEYRAGLGYDDEGTIEYIYGSVRNFTIPAPTIATLRAITSSTKTSAVLRAELTSVAEPVDVHFQYALAGEPWIDVGAATYGPIEPVGNASFVQHHRFDLTGLNPHVLYEFRAVLEYSEDTLYGDVHEFMIQTVTVLDSTDDSPVEDVYISLLSIDPVWGLDFYSDADGDIFHVHDVDVTTSSFDYVAMHRDYNITTGTFVGAEHTFTIDPRTEWRVTIGDVVYQEEVMFIPVEDARLAISWPGGSIPAARFTDDTGMFEFYVDFPPWETEFTVGITHEDHNPKTVTFTGSVSDRIILTSVPYVFNIGPIRDENGNPLEAYRVEATANLGAIGRTDPYIFEGVAYTDADGYAEFSAIPFVPDNRAYTVTVSKDAWTGRRVSVQPGIPIYVCVFDVEVENTEGDAIEDVAVSVSHGHSDAGVWETIKYTDADGVAHGFKVVLYNPNDNLFVSVSHGDYLTQIVSTGIDDVTMVMELRPIVTVGPLVNRGGIPVPNAEIRLERVDPVEIVGTRFSNSQGLASFKADYGNAADLQFAVFINHDDLDEEFLEEFYGLESGPIRLPIGDPSVITVGPARDNFGIFVPGVLIELYHGEERLDIKSTGATGIATFEVEYLNPVGKNFTFIATHDELAVPYEGAFTGPVSGSFDLDIGEVEPPETYTVRVGPIRNAKGELVSGVGVRLSWNSYLTGVTDTNGMVDFEVPVDPATTTFTYRITHHELEDGYVTGTFTGARSGGIDINIGEIDTVEPETNWMLIAGLGILIIIIIIVVIVVMKKKPAAEEPLEEEEPLFDEEEEPLFDEEEEPLFEEEEEPLFDEEEEPLFEEEEEPLFEEEEEPLFEEEEEF